MSYNEPNIDSKLTNSSSVPTTPYKVVNFLPVGLEACVSFKQGGGVSATYLSIDTICEFTGASQAEINLAIQIMGFSSCKISLLGKDYLFTGRAIDVIWPHLDTQAKRDELRRTKAYLHSFLIPKLSGGGLVDFIAKLAYQEAEVPQAVTPVINGFDLDLNKFLESFGKLLKAKNANYGNSALTPKKIFYKQEAEPQNIESRIDEKIARIQSQTQVSKNDTIDLIGYLTILCLKNGWTDLDDLLN